MAPKKEKKEQFTGDQASTLIIDYLRQQNRPYTATDISTNLHNAVTKTTAAKLLKELQENGQIEGRASGKQLVYHAIQDPDDCASPEEMKAMDVDIEKIKQETATLRSQVKELQSSLNTLRAMPSATELEESLAATEAEIQELDTTLAPLRMHLLEPVDLVKKAAAESEYARVEKQFSHRRKQFKEFWGALTESYEGDCEELWERLGLEEDP